jgi:glyoxylase-like metal-dependent hydrolase (beta-lactamase superfamily II)
MSAMIPLDSLLLEATASPYRNLVTRPTGVAVRDRVVVALRDRPRTQALLDFSRIGLVDFSCADEVVAKLIRAVHDLPVSRVVLTGIREDHAEAINHALARYGLVVLALEAETARPRLLGEVPADWASVFGVLVASRTPHDTARVATALTWPPARAHQALEGLCACRCVVAGPDATYDLGALA